MIMGKKGAFLLWWSIFRILSFSYIGFEYAMIAYRSTTDFTAKQKIDR